MCGTGYNDRDNVTKQDTTEKVDEYAIPPASLPPVFDDEEPTPCALCGKSGPCSCQ